MRYERSFDPGPVPTAGAGKERTGTWWGRPLPVALVVTGLVGTGLAVGLGAGGPAHPVEDSPTAVSAGRAFLEANVLEENLGAPAPPGTTGATWALRADRIDRADRGRTAHLALAEHGWIGRSGTVALLSRRQAAGIVSGQSEDVRLVFGGTERRQQLEELSVLVSGEERSAQGLVSPGGASILRWYSVTVTGAIAHADAVVSQWVQHDSVVGPPGRERVASSIVADEVDAKATLERTGGRWRVVSLSLSPWQQPT